MLDYDADAGVIKFISTPTTANADFKDVTNKIQKWTGRRFVFSIENNEFDGKEEAVKSINEEVAEELEKEKNMAINSDVVQSFVKKFGGEVVSAEKIYEN